MEATQAVNMDIVLPYEVVTVWPNLSHKSKKAFNNPSFVSSSVAGVASHTLEIFNSLLFEVELSNLIN